MSLVILGYAGSEKSYQELHIGLVRSELMTAQSKALAIYHHSTDGQYRPTQHNNLHPLISTQQTEIADS